MGLKTLPAEKPADLPDLPIRVRLGLWSYPLFAVFFLSLFLFGMVAGAPKDPGLFWLTAAVAVALIGLSWRGSLKSHRRMAENRRWWLVEMEDDDGDLTFRWEPQTWLDLAPRMPVLLAILLLFCAMPVLAWFLNVALFATLQDTLSDLAIAGAYTSAALLYLFTVPSAFTSRKSIKAVLSTQGAKISGPRLIFGYRTLFPLRTSWLHWVYLTIDLDQVRSTSFCTRGVKITGPITQLRKRHILIPTRDPHQRRAIANWAASHAIPVTGDI